MWLWFVSLNDQSNEINSILMYEIYFSVRIIINSLFKFFKILNAESLLQY